MGTDWTQAFILGLKTLNDILTAGVAITAFSLLLYALSFNLKDRVSRSFTLILLAVVVVFSAETVAIAVQTPILMDVAYRLQWLGLIFLPPAYLHLSDALLVTVGRPSRGRRRLAVRMMYLVSAVFLILLVQGWLVGDLVLEAPAPHLQRTIWTAVFTLYAVSVEAWALANFLRAYRRVLTASGRRRMLYLMAGATAPALGTYPYLLYGSTVAARYPGLFWAVAVLVNFIVGGLLVVMAYAVAFFGVTWPDRVVKVRLFKWLLRGPVTASLALGAMTVVRRLGEAYGGYVYTAAVPFSVVVVILVVEHAITLLGPRIERWLFLGADRDQLLLLQSLEERLLTQSDLRQFLDTILAAVRDVLQTPFAFVAALERPEQDGLIVTSGAVSLFEKFDLAGVLERVSDELTIGHEFYWRDYLIIPLYAHGSQDEAVMLGLLGSFLGGKRRIDEEQRQTLWLLAERAVLALEDRVLQQRIFQTLENIQPQAEYLQKMRAAGRYGHTPEWLTDDARFNELVKDALSHYWGGPKLTENPLLQLQIVEEMAEKKYEGNRANALRALLRQALESVRPEGERRFTTEWILYNILELKFFQGQKVRDVAARLALSEADLYRKQRVAIAAVARAILELENSAREKNGKNK